MFLKKNLIFLSIVGALLISVEAVILSRVSSSEMSLDNVEAISLEEINNPCGNVTFIPNEALRNVACWSGATHSKCKEETNVCCDPSKQTDCPPVIEIDLGL